MKLYIKNGSRYREATLGEVIATTAISLAQIGQESIAYDFIEKIIGSLSSSHVSQKDALMITHNVVDQLKGLGPSK